MMGLFSSKTKSKSESSRPSAVSPFDSVNDAVPASYSSPIRKTSYSSSVTTFKVQREQTQTYKSVRTSSTNVTSGTSTGSPRYSPVYKRPQALSQDARRIEGSQASDKYDLSKKAYALVFHHYEFDDKKHNRDGSMKDMEKIKEVLKNYRIDQIKIHSNYSLRAVRQVMDEVSKRDFSKNSCLMLFIMSHGDIHNTILAKDGEWYSLHEDIVEKCTLNNTLKGKPKIFVIQACRGNAHMKTDSTMRVIGDTWDIVIFQSTYEGSVSWRRTDQGTLFMQEFLNIIQSINGGVDVHEINMRLNARFGKESIKQTPTMSSTLRKRLFLHDLR